MKNIVIKTQKELDVIYRLMSRVVRSKTGCWDFQGALSRLGYGRISYKKEREAHRVSFVLFKGHIPNSKIVAHDCDNPKCVNPLHLRLLTRSENHVDAVKRGRIKTGHESPYSKLSKTQRDEVKRLKSLMWNNRQLAVKFNVNPETIRRILLHGN
jgi:hypothetical protein